MTPFRSPVSDSITVPEYSESTSTVTSSKGSILTPSTILVKILGGEIMNSKPSRRICSMRIPSCNSPLPYTVDFSLSVSHFCTEMVTLLSVSAISLALILEDVTIVPSVPAKGPSLVPKSIQSVGGAKGGVSTGSGTGFSSPVTVSPTAISSGTPTKVTISPAEAVAGTNETRDIPRLTHTSANSFEGVLIPLSPRFRTVIDPFFEILPE
mmetsp:Transcript_10850/g.15994  ORF Transcript_10850/g.15994 Transcript_10850/m.15994 type:complete len:210 (-) Transcript_10850:1047-1676(-)